MRLIFHNEFANLIFIIIYIILLLSELISFPLTDKNDFKRRRSWNQSIFSFPEADWMQKAAAEAHNAIDIPFKLLFCLFQANDLQLNLLSALSLLLFRYLLDFYTRLVIFTSMCVFIYVCVCV